MGGRGGAASAPLRSGSNTTSAVCLEINIVGSETSVVDDDPRKAQRQPERQFPIYYTGNPDRVTLHGFSHRYYRCTAVQGARYSCRTGALPMIEGIFKRDINHLGMVWYIHSKGEVRSRIRTHCIDGKQGWSCLPVSERDSANEHNGSLGVMAIRLALHNTWVERRGVEASPESRPRTLIHNPMEGHKPRL
jgi:hypothetical protein